MKRFASLGRSLLVSLLLVISLIIGMGVTTSAARAELPTCPYNERSPGCTADKYGQIACYKVDFHGRDIATALKLKSKYVDVQFHCSDLSNANFSGLDLISFLTYNDLTGANLSGVYLEGLQYNDLTGADLSGVELDEDDGIDPFDHNNLTSANLSGLDLRETGFGHKNRFAKANLRGSKWDFNGPAQYIAPDGSSPTDILDFSGANFQDASLNSTEFIQANLTGADFSGAQMSDVKFTGSNLTGANLSGASLQGAIRKSVV